MKRKSNLLVALLFTCVVVQAQNKGVIKYDETQAQLDKHVLATQSATHKDAPAEIKTVINLCTGYFDCFYFPGTNLVYGKKLNTSKGIDILESPDNIDKGMVGNVKKPMGYGAGMEDVAYHNGMLLYALCDAEEKTGEKYFATQAQNIYKGLIGMIRLSPYPGFVPRGPHPNGKSYYKDISLDQNTLYMCGLWRFYNSRLASSEQRNTIKGVVHDIMNRLEKNNWQLLVENNSAPCWEGGSLLSMNNKWALVLLTMVGITKDITQDQHWIDVYNRFSNENDGERWKAIGKATTKTGDRRYTMFQNQHIFRGETLRKIESDPAKKQMLRDISVATAQDMLTCSYFEAWRSSEWFKPEVGGKYTNAPKEDIDRANKYLQMLDLSLASKVTIFDIWNAYKNKLKQPELKESLNQYQAISIAYQSMFCHIAFFSEDEQAVAKAKELLNDMQQTIDINCLHHGFGTNYYVLASLWNLK